jgi:hypothetical protein
VVGSAELAGSPRKRVTTFECIDAVPELAGLRSRRASCSRRREDGGAPADHGRDRPRALLVAEHLIRREE